MAGVTTLPKLYQPLMDGPSVVLPYCCVCGRTHPLEQHHVVRRSQGNVYRNGVKMPKPVLTLCGFGNNLKGPDGAYYCHGMAHNGMLHFRWVETEQRTGTYYGTRCTGGHWEYLMTPEPVKYQKALEMDGWRAIHEV